MRKQILFTAAIVAALLLGAGIAWASIPGPDGVIHGCYKTGNPAQGALIAIDSAASCPSGYTALNWNQTGPQGPAGPTGATGPQGPAGAPGISGYELVVSAARQLDPGATSSAQAVCPLGKTAISGGVWVDPQYWGQDIRIISDSQNSADGINFSDASWVGVVSNKSQISIRFTVTAICIIIAN